MAFVIEEGIKKEIRCPNCGKLIGYDTTDMYFTENDDEITGLGIDCPCCCHVILIKEVREGQYPDSFYDFSNGVDINNSAIQQWIDNCVNTIKNSNNNIDYTYTASGNTLVMAYRTDDNVITVIVTKNYKETEIFI